MLPLCAQQAKEMQGKGNRYSAFKHGSPQHPQAWLVTPLAPCTPQAKEMLKEAGASDQASVLGGATIAGFIAAGFRCVEWPL